MFETSKALMRRLHDSRFATRYFVGDGIDIGAGSDFLGQYTEQFPLMSSCRPWDLKDGDAQLLATVPDTSLDFAHSSHCLEHMRDPREALKHWLRVLRPGGHLVVMIPDEDLYEQGVFPSTFNSVTSGPTMQAKRSAKSVNCSRCSANSRAPRRPSRSSCLMPRSASSSRAWTRP
jgi:SAM-dependent methyltransferase